MHEKIKGNDKSYYDITTYCVGTLLINVNYASKYLQKVSHLKEISTIFLYIVKVATLMYVKIGLYKI